MRTLECDRLATYLKNQNNEDITLIGACTVTKDVEKHTLNAIAYAKGKMIVCGCISENIRKAAEKAGAIDIFNTTELYQIFHFGDKRFPDIENTISQSTISDEALCNRQYKSIKSYNRNLLQRIIQRNNKIPFLVIARGCNCNCSFCHSRFYIGKVKSKSIDAITAEYLGLIKKHRFINIIAEDIGSYGDDINVSLPYLLKTLDAIPRTENVRWMLDGLQPNNCIKFKEALIPLFSKRRINAMSVAVQSGSERILELMNRKTNVNAFIDTISELRYVNSKLYLQGVFIVGFPSETDQDFLDTINLIVSCGFNDVTLIPYSEFTICDSSKFNEKIEEDIKFQRIANAESLLKTKGIQTRR